MFDQKEGADVVAADYGGAGHGGEGGFIRLSILLRWVRHGFSMGLPQWCGCQHLLIKKQGAIILQKITAIGAMDANNALSSFNFSCK